MAFIILGTYPTLPRLSKSNYSGTSLVGRYKVSDTKSNNLFILNLSTNAHNGALTANVSVDLVEEDRCVHRCFYDFNKRYHSERIARKSDKIVSELYTERFTKEFIEKLLVTLEEHYLLKAVEA